MEPNKEQIKEEDEENFTNLNEMYLNEISLKRSNSFNSFIKMLNEKKEEEEEEGEDKNEKKETKPKVNSPEKNNKFNIIINNPESKINI